MEDRKKVRLFKLATEAYRGSDAKLWVSALACAGVAIKEFLTVKIRKIGRLKYIKMAKWHFSKDIKPPNWQRRLMMRRHVSCLVSLPF